MGERVRVVRHEGRLLAAKEPGDGGPDRLQAEAELLRRAQVPGVVELVGLTEGERPLLLTRWVGPRSAADLSVPVAPEQAVAITLAVAATVGRLHRAGLVHGHLDPTHVLLDAGGRPVLCGFGGAGPIGAPERRPATDPGLGGDLPHRPSRRPADDVAGLGRVLDHLLGPAGSPEPGGPFSRGTRRARARRRSLRALVASATAPDPGARPSVTAFAHSLRKVVPDARLGDDPRDGDATHRPTRHRTPRRPDAQNHQADRRPHERGEHRAPLSRARSLVPVALVLVAVSTASYFGLSAWWAPGRERAAVADTTAMRSAISPATTAPATTTSLPAATGGATVVDHDGRRYAVGAPGDVVVVGPWLCDGTDLPAVLHPDDGTVHLFRRWAPAGGTVEAVTVATVPGADGLRGATLQPGCAQLLVTGSGRDLTILTAEDLR
jgi:hypothetical protein